MFDSDKEIGESLDPDKKAGSKLKLILIIVGCVILIAAIIVLIVFLTKGDKEENNISANLTTIPLPEDIIIDELFQMKEKILKNYMEPHLKFQIKQMEFV